MTFDIDENGILHVSAKDKATGKSQSITITAPNKMSEEEIQEKIREAERHAEEDRKFKELVEAKNTAEALIYQTEKLMKENEAVIGDLKPKILDKISDLRSAMESEDVLRIKNATDALQTALHEVSARIYGQASGATNAYQRKTQDEIEEERFRRATGQDDGVIDAEYE